MGLIVTLNSSIKDYFCKKHNTMVFICKYSRLIVSTGEVRDLLIPTGSDVNVELSIVTQVADEETRRIRNTKRCYFSNENLRAELSSYSQSKCLAYCRLESIAFLYECLPYYTPNGFPNKRNWNICSFPDLECLDHFFVTWRSFKPIEDKLGIPYKSSDTIKCPGCYPLCSFNHYYYKKETTSLAKTKFFKPES